MTRRLVRRRNTRRGTMRRIVALVLLPVMAFVSICLCKPAHAAGADHCAVRHTAQPHTAHSQTPAKHHMAQPDDASQQDPAPPTNPPCPHCVATLAVPSSHAATVVPEAPVLAVAMPMPAIVIAIDVPVASPDGSARYTSLPPPLAGDILTQKHSRLI